MIKVVSLKYSFIITIQDFHFFIIDQILKLRGSPGCEGEWKRGTCTLAFCYTERRPGLQDTQKMEDGMSGLGSDPAELGVSLGPVRRHGVSGLGDVYLEMVVGRLERWRESQILVWLVCRQRGLYCSPRKPNEKLQLSRQQAVGSRRPRSRGLVTRGEGRE